MLRIPLAPRLLLLAGVAILPLALMSAVALSALLQMQRDDIRASTVGLARALATAVDTQLRLSVSALETLAVALPLGSDAAEDLPRAHAMAGMALRARSEWQAVQLSGPDGAVIFTTSFPFGTPAGEVIELGSHATVAASAQAAVGPLTAGPRGRLGVPVRVPVLRDGRVHYVLSAIVRPEAILQVVQRQQVPDGWIVSVFDAEQRRIARSRDHERHVGQRPGPSLTGLIAELGERDAIYGLTEVLEGSSVHTAVARVDAGRWFVALGVPTEMTAGALRESSRIYGGGIALSLVFGVLAAWVVSRSITRPMRRLRDAALALGRGAWVAPTRSEVAEIEAVSQALQAAGAQRRRAEADRQDLLDAERRARGEAERATRRLQFLATASATLSSTLEECATLDAIARIVVPQLADACRIELASADGEPLARRLHGEGAEREDLCSHGVPLVARGRTLGALVALRTAPGSGFGDDDRVLLAELARRAALALDNVRLLAAAQAALREAEGASRVKDEFLAMLGHELRNPLAPIVSTLEVMARRDGERHAGERRIIERQVRHLSRLVDDLLDVSRIVAGKVELRRSDVDLRDVIARALEQLQPLLALRSTPPRLELPDKPLAVWGDPLRLTQVVANLLANAAKFSGADGRIAIEAGSDGAEAWLAVEDDGEGIAPDLLPRVFDTFVQGAQRRDAGQGGLGLGLAIARGIVDMHGGRIGVQSAGRGQGSRFTVHLPLAAEPVAPAPLARVAEAPPAGALRVLVVDDNDDAAGSLAVLLQMEGHDVRTAATGAAALAVAAGFAPAVVLLDIGLPDTDGYTLAQRLREAPATRDACLIAVTGYGRAPDRERSRAAGFDEHLTKPVPIGALLQRLATLTAEPA